MHAHVSSGSYCTSAIVGSRVYSNTLATLLSHCLDSEMFSGRNQNIGCALAWGTVACDSESEHPFYSVEQFHRICAGH